MERYGGKRREREEERVSKGGSKREKEGEKQRVERGERGSVLILLINYIRGWIVLIMTS